MKTTSATKKALATLLLALALAGGRALPALAHKVVAGAYVAGDHIEGEIGFSDGSMAKNIDVEVLAEDGSTLGMVRTGEDGTFTFTPSRKVTHIFRADLGGGHVADFRVEASDLPGGATPAAAGQPGPAAAGREVMAASAGAPVGITDAQRSALTEAVRNEVRPLRREIIALKEKNDLQSVLGGIGYIVGLFGLWFFLAARRQNAKKGAV